MIDETHDERIRLTRESIDRGPSLTERLSDRLDRLSFASPFHRLRLKGRFPLKLLGVPADPVPGNAERGALLKAGRLARAGHDQAMVDARLDAADAPASWRDWVHGWGWLRDLATVSLTNSEALRAEALARRWLTRFHDYDETAWAPHLTGRRILMAISHAPLAMPRHDHIHRSAMLNGIARWARHLDRAVPRMAPGFARVEAAAGLLGASLMLPGAEDRLTRSEELLALAVDELLLDDGSPASRQPLELANLADLMTHLQAFHAARSKLVADVVTATHERACAGLAALAAGDGMADGWHGGQPNAAQMVRALPDTAGGQPLTDARFAGFQRMVAGATTLIVDIGPPPVSRANPMGHASTLAFTMTDGARPLIVSCGAARGAGGERALPAVLVDGLRTTAAHSALVLADTNSSRLGAGSQRGGVEEVLAQYRASTQGRWLEASHDGWRRRYGYDHLRRLWLSHDGTDLRGEDCLLPTRGRLYLKRERLPLAIRFHLAPGAEAVITHDGKGALIRLPGQGRQPDIAWAFRASFNHAPGHLSIEPSLHIDAEGASHEIRQIVLTSHVDPGEAGDIGWSLRRQGQRTA